jgi:nicotinate-nucleotide adenylyltransferase
MTAADQHGTTLDAAARAGARIGILGGTLDPIHLGHLETAFAARAALSLDRLVILPTRIPPHRHHQPLASPFHRFAMASLAVHDLADTTVSDTELCAPGPSYTADTLERLHATGLVASQIFFITGADAFAEIETWRRYPDVLRLAHFVVVSRPGHAVASLGDRLPALASRMVAAGAAAGTLSTPAIFLVEASTPDISSSEIRRRIARGESLAGLVPPPVETHIVRHGLYGAGHLHGQS